MQAAPCAQVADYTHHPCYTYSTCRLHRVLELLEVFEEQKQARGSGAPDDLAKTYDKDDP